MNLGLSLKCPLNCTPAQEEEEDRGHPGGEGGQAAGGAGGEGGQGGGREADEHAGGEGRREGEAAKARREQQLTVSQGDDGCVELHYGSFNL